ncbi:glutathione S-transferase [Falsihalocynthiibacter arcticus]|uniref:Glutathione S-transferase n=1 Tax=Falsihalocynthiibacter arcticus TaxID=1579316 RepID=A0A126UYH1_9RHOB|nr:glutathione S-transferase [Falsihalocynthiibacter arcticus]AML51103.1 glutathione S-transferase [Falsihalocynthiibacter arcticus]
MELFYSPTSPYVRKVMVLLHETGRLNDVQLVPTHGTPLAPAKGYAAQNPLSKVPALARPDGATLYDSRVICQYLDARAKSGLYGNDNSRWDILTLEATADGILDAAILMVYETRLRPVDKQFHDYIEAQWHKIANAIAALEARWIPHLEGPISMGQIAVACALGYVDFRHDDRGWRQSAPLLDDWYAGFAARDSMTATIPPK